MQRFLVHKVRYGNYATFLGAKNEPSSPPKKVRKSTYKEVMLTKLPVLDSGEEEIFCSVRNDLVFVKHLGPPSIIGI